MSPSQASTSALTIRVRRALGVFPVKDMASIGIAPHSDGWLQVRIDGKVGWIHGNEDLDALGLPEPQDEIN